jgi:hypothetical protein
VNEPTRVAACSHCGAQNVITRCERCGRGFVLTKAHVEGRLRNFDEPPISEVPQGVIRLCDFDQSRDAGASAELIVIAGLRQRTCTACHTEFLSSYGY